VVQTRTILVPTVTQGHQALQPNALRKNAASLRSLISRRANAFVTLTITMEILTARISSTPLGTN
jgi:hypothetical protein